MKGFEIMDISKKRWLQAGLALFCSVAVTLSALPALADEDIESLENQTSALENELAGINQDILDLNDDINTAEMQIEILQGEIGRTSDALAEAETNEQQQYEDMKTRIKYMYENGNASLLEMLFSAEDMTDFLNKADFIEHLSEYDRNALNELENIHQEIADQKTALEEQQASMVDLQAELEKKKTELQAKADETSTDLKEVNAKLEQAKEKEARRLAAEEESRETSTSGSGGTTSGGVINASVDEITLMAALLDCEAHHDYDAMLAVATVIMNRVEDPRFPNSISGVIMFMIRIEYRQPSGRLAFNRISTVMIAAPRENSTRPCALVGEVTGSVSMNTAPKTTPPLNRCTSGYHMNPGSPL